MAQKTDADRNRASTTCPACGAEPDDVTHMAEAERDNQTMPAMFYDHDGGPLCIEWADGELTQG